jgi:hypothetical protein
LVPSLKDGRGAIASCKKPVAGMRPSGEERMQIVPPVITIKTLDSGYCDGDPGVPGPENGSVELELYDMMKQKKTDKEIFQ